MPEVVENEYEFQYIKRPDDLTEQQKIRIDAAAKYAQEVSRIIKEFSPWVAEAVLEDAKSVFTGVDCPWHFAWVRTGKDYNSPTDITYRETLMNMGYAPADLRSDKFQFVFGREAAFLALEPKNNEHFKRLAEKRLCPPQPQIPAIYAEKVGFLIPPMVDKSTGYCYMYHEQLWYCTKESMKARNDKNSRLANGLVQRLNPLVKGESGLPNFLSDVTPEQVLETLNKNPFS
jgi:hypothetical protein